MKKIKIGIVYSGGQNWAAGQIYIKNLILAVNSLKEADKKRFHISVLIDHHNKKKKQLFKGKVDTIVDIPSWMSICQTIKNPIAKKIPFLDRSFINPYEIDFIYPYYAGKNAPFKWGAWIPDFQHVHLPQFFSSREIDQRNFDHKRIALYAPVIVLSSQDAKNDLCNLYPFAEEKSRVLNFVSILEEGVLEVNPVEYQKKYDLKDKYLIVCNQFWRHKDHHVIIDALKILQKNNINVNVVCTGSTKDSRNPNYFGNLEEVIKAYGLEKRIKILGFIPRNDQIQIMRRAIAVIQPSWFEGWSTVVEDSRALGKPIILSDIDVHKEQDPNNSVFFKKGTPDDLAEAIKHTIYKYGPGPDKKNEHLANKENIELRHKFGTKFLEIVAKTVNG